MQIKTLDKAFKRVNHIPARSYCLVSLLKIMKRFSAENFALIASVVQIWVDTKKFDPEERWQQAFDQLLENCDQVGLEFSAKYAREMRATLLAPGATVKHLNEMASILQGRLEDELEMTVFFALPREHSKFFDSRKLFGQAVLKAFPSCLFDIEESGKCLALARNTACVMHLARVLEVGLKAVRTALGLPPLPIGKQMNWGEILRQIWDEIGARNKAADPVWMAKQKPFFENVHADLSSVNSSAIHRCMPMRLMTRKEPRIFSTCQRASCDIWPNT